jgi:hypothetical protein
VNSGQDVKAMLKAGLRPRRPLAPEWVYALGFTLLALAPALLLLLTSDTPGWAARAGAWAAAPPVLSAVLAALAGLRLARAMTPGSPTVAALPWLSVWLVLLAGALALSTSRAHAPAWGSDEQHCFDSGLIVGAFVLLPVFLLLRRGAVLRINATGAAAGVLGGLAGLLALESSCDNPAFWHIALSHVTVPLALPLLVLLLLLALSLLRRLRLR